MPDLESCTWCRSESSGQRLILTLHVQPGAKRTEAVGLHGDALKVRLAAPPVEGAANAALLEFLAGIFCVPLRQVTLRQGAKSRRKVVEIRHVACGLDALFKATGVKLNADSGSECFLSIKSPDPFSIPNK